MGWYPAIPAAGVLRSAASCSTWTKRPYDVPFVVQASVAPAVARASTLSVPQRLHPDVGKPEPQRPTAIPADDSASARVAAGPAIGPPEESLTSALGQSASAFPCSWRKRSEGSDESAACTAKKGVIVACAASDIR